MITGYTCHLVWYQAPVSLVRFHYRVLCVSITGYFVLIVCTYFTDFYHTLFSSYIEMFNSLWLWWKFSFNYFDNKWTNLA